MDQLDQWSDYIAKVLGREPRGLREIAGWTPDCLPAVIRVAPIVDGKPFPTLYWLIDPVWNLTLDRLEAAGRIAAIQEQVDESPALRARMRSDHAAYRRSREKFMTSDDKQFLTAKGMMSAFTDRGVGGIVEPDRVRCLHTWYAAHWICPNAIGQLIDELVEAEG